MEELSAGENDVGLVPFFEENQETASGKLASDSLLPWQTLQDSNTDQLVFGIPELIEDLSTWFTLEPGDVIATGTPPGVGFARKPPVYLKAGDVCEVEIDGLGVLRNPVAAFEG